MLAKEVMKGAAREGPSPKATLSSESCGSEWDELWLLQRWVGGNEAVSADANGNVEVARSDTSTPSGYSKSLMHRQSELATRVSRNERTKSVASVVSHIPHSNDQSV